MKQPNFTRKTQECSETAKLDRADEISPLECGRFRSVDVRECVGKFIICAIARRWLSVRASLRNNKVSGDVEIIGVCRVVVVVREDSRLSSGIHRANVVMLAHKARWQLFVMRQQI